MSEQKQSAPHRRGPMGGPGGGPHGMMGEKSKNFKGTMISLIKHLKKFIPHFIIVMLFAFLSTVLVVIGPKVLAKATDKIQEGVIQRQVYDMIMEKMPEGTTSLPAGITGDIILEQIPEQYKDNINDAMKAAIQDADFSERPMIDLSEVGKFLIFTLIIYVASGLLSYIQGFIMTGVTQKITYEFRRDISHKINRLPLGYFHRQTTGDVLSRITNDVDTISQSLSQSLTQIITAFTGVIGILIMMFSISWILTVVSLLVIPISLILVRIVVGFSQKHFKNQQKYLGQINGHIEEMYGGHTVIKAFNKENDSINAFEQINEKLYKSAWKSQFLSGLMMPVTNFIGNIGYVAVCVLGGRLALSNMITIGGIQAFLQYIKQFNQQISQVASISNTLQATAAAAERVFEFLNEEDEIPESKNPIKIDDVKGQVIFAHVNFGYEKGQTIINDFNTIVEPGQKVAIVGPTGAGKTTMVKLLMRFFDVDQGAILIDGIDIKDMKRKDLRDTMGMVLQDTWLFNGSIKENIRYGNLNATDEQVIEAAKAAHVHHFIKTLPGGYNMELNEEASNVSQGQKQLLTIARAILSDPKILILDEATSSVDTRTEVLIQKAMNALMEGRTSFIIAHRLSTIKDADKILVMNNGDIIEQGTHDELMSLEGFYYNLYNSQFEKS